MSCIIYGIGVVLTLTIFCALLVTPSPQDKLREDEEQMQWLTEYQAAKKII